MKTDSMTAPLPFPEDPRLRACRFMRECLPMGRNLLFFVFNSGPKGWQSVAVGERSEPTECIQIIKTSPEDLFQRKLFRRQGFRLGGPGPPCPPRPAWERENRRSSAPSADTLSWSPVFAGIHVTGWAHEPLFVTIRAKLHCQEINGLNTTPVAPVKTPEIVFATLTSLIEGAKMPLATGAGLTQLVECQLPKLDVAGSSPVSRSILFVTFWQALSTLAPIFRGFEVFAFIVMPLTDAIVFMSGIAVK